METDIIECVIVLPSKLFYGNNVPACLVVLNKKKPRSRRNRILMIWASRNCHQANPQNLLRPSDLMRILVPWRAYGNLDKAQRLVGKHEKTLAKEEEAERTRRLQDIEDAYAPLIDPLPAMKEELEALQEADFKAWSESPNTDHPFFGVLFPLQGQIDTLTAGIADAGREKKKAAREKLRKLKAKLREKSKDAKREYKARAKELKRQIKEAEKLLEERDAAEAEVNEQADREIVHIKKAAADLLRICSDPEEAARYFTVTESPEIEENEFNLNLPRYVQTFEPEKPIELSDALQETRSAKAAADEALDILGSLLGDF